jgi:hypothetical protein
MVVRGTSAWVRRIRMDLIVRSKGGKRGKKSDALVHS